MSVFLALDLDEAVRHEVMSLTERARTSVTAKWLPAEKLHLTLVFLGNPDVEAVKAKLLAAPVQASVRLRLEGAGTFVTARAPSVVWLGVGGERARLDALQTWSRELLGVEERQPWKPHVTLARAHSGEGALDSRAAEWASFRSAEFEARHLTLYESTHHRFHVLLRVALAAWRE
jgi:2'-5' RNA ligase